MNALKPGIRVQLKRVQPTIFGKPQYPGRIGTIIRKNPFGQEPGEGYWYVLLDATSRAKGREILIYGSLLEILNEETEEDR